LIIRIVLLIFLLCSTSSFAQEDVCEGVESATISTSGNFTLCWKRNDANDNVDHYKVFDNPTDVVETYTTDFGEEVHMMLDSDCLTIHCITSAIPAMPDPGVHYLTVRGFDSINHYSGPSNSVVLTVTVTVLPAENLRVMVISQ